MSKSVDVIFERKSLWWHWYKGIILDIAAVGFVWALTFSGRRREEEVKGILGEQIRFCFFVGRQLHQRALW